MADIPTSQFQHYCGEIDSAVNEVIAARGSEASLSARLAAIVSGCIEDCYGVGTQISTNGTVDITQLGRFYCTNAATAATVTGAPWKDSGFFGYTERSIAAADRYIQVAFRNDDNFRVAKRRYIGTWQPWSYIDTYDEGNAIPDSANLNDYTRGGKYYGGNSAGNSVLNLPVANGSFNFSLEVKIASPVNTLQYLTILRTADDPYIYKRRYYNGSWGSWYRYEGASVASLQSAPALMQAGRINAELTDSETLTKVEGHETESREEEW